jgi:hypothetical protein
MGPIYASDSRYVLAVLGETYGNKRWTLFEASQYHERIESGEVIPIWSKKAPGSPFDEARRRGGLTFDANIDLRKQAMAHAEILSRMIAERVDTD